MRLTPINRAEAIFVPFFDESISDLAKWSGDAPGANGFRLIQDWSVSHRRVRQHGKSGVLRVDVRLNFTSAA